MKVSIYAVNRPITTCMIFVAIMLLGLVSYFRLPVQLIPDITLPRIGIFAQNQSSAQENLDNITKEVEALVAEMPRVRRIRSNTRTGGVWMDVEFEYGTDIQYALVDLEERLAAFRNNLDDRRTFIDAFPFSTADWQATFMFLSVRGRGDSELLFKTASEKVEQQLKSISGVSSVTLYGLRTDTVEIELNPDLLASYKLDLGQVINRVQAAVSEDTYLGQLKVPGETHYVRMSDRIHTPEELANLYVDSRGIVRLADLGTTMTGESVDQWINRSDGKNSISIRMEREASRNLIDLARDTRKRVEQINATLPPGTELVIDEDFAKYVEDAISQVKSLALIGALLALLVPLIFFRSLRVALIVFLSVPICLISVFNLFYAANMSINIFSIVGLALGVGMLVDNSIVVVENSFRLYNKGMSPADAARQGGADVGRGLLAATLTTVIAFLPIVFLDGEFKLFVKEPALGLVFPLLLSLVVALTVVPVLTWLVLRTRKRRKTTPRMGQWISRAHKKVLKASMRYRGRVIFIISLVVMFTWMESCQRVNQSTTQNQANWDYMEFYYEAFQGATLSEVDRAVVQIEDRLLEHPNIKSFSVAFNREGGEARIRIKPVEEREKGESWREIYDTMLEFVGEVPGLETSLYRRSRQAGPPPVSMGPEGRLDLKGLDARIIKEYAGRLIEALRAHPDITNAKLDDDRDEPQMLARVDREKTQLFGVSSMMIARYIGATRSGGTISSVQLVDGDQRTDVVFTIEDAEGSTVDDVRDMTVYTQKGSVPLAELVRFQASSRADRFRRRDRQSNEELIYYYRNGTNQTQLVEDIKQITATLPNPGGVVAEFTGDQERIDRRARDAAFTSIWAAILVWVIMAAVFESFWIPLTILATNPLMIIGIVWGLDIAGLPLDDLAFFGIILLIGLAVNNGIVLMDRALALQSQGFSRTRAVFEASVTRLRPILMTYLTTVLGLLPLALVGKEEDQWRPVAVVVIGGLSSATLLTLIVLPCFYLIGDDFVRWARRPFLNFLATLFEIPESLAAIFFHPVRVFRREIPVFVLTRTLIRSVSFFLWQTAKIPWRVAVHLPRDLYVCILPWRRRRRFDREAAGGDVPRRGLLRRILHGVAWLLFLPIRIARWTLRIAWRLTRFLFRLATAPPRFAWRLLRRKPVESAAGAPGETVSIQSSGEPSPIRLANIQVVYPATGFRAARTWLPAWCPGRLDPQGAAVHALHGVHIEIDRGLFGLLGPNGAGKTTLIRAITGLLEPTRGSVRLFGLSHREAPGVLAPLIGYLPQTHGHYEWMTLYEYLDYFATVTARTLEQARALGVSHPAVMAHLARLDDLGNARSRHFAILRAIDEVNLHDVAHARIATFSGGMKQRAGIARILLQTPPILIVDEPTAGLDPIERVRIRVLLSRMARTRLVILSTHIVEDLEHGCDRLAILNKGRIIFHGTPEGLKQTCHGRTWEVYMDETPREHATIEQSGMQILTRFIRDGRAGMRLLTPTPFPLDRGTAVSPTLEDAVLASLRGNASVG